MNLMKDFCLVLVRAAGFLFICTLLFIYSVLESMQNIKWIYIYKILEDMI